MRKTKVYASSKNTSLESVRADFSAFVGTVEDMTNDDIKEFEEVTGFKLDLLLEAYSDLVNSL